MASLASTENELKPQLKPFVEDFCHMISCKINDLIKAQRLRAPASTRSTP
jgi:hypothetical protein